MTFGINLMTFLGVLILAVPVLSLNDRKRSAARMGPGAAPGTGLARLRGNAGPRIAQWVNGWRAADQVCLYTGYLLLLSSSFLRLFT